MKKVLISKLMCIALLGTLTTSILTPAIQVKATPKIESTSVLNSNQSVNLDKYFYLNDKNVIKFDINKAMQDTSLSNEEINKFNEFNKKQDQINQISAKAGRNYVKILSNGVELGLSSFWCNQLVNILDMGLTAAAAALASIPIVGPYLSKYANILVDKYVINALKRYARYGVKLSIISWKVSVSRQ